MLFKFIFGFLSFEKYRKIIPNPTMWCVIIPVVWKKYYWQQNTGVGDFKFSSLVRHNLFFSKSFILNVKSWIWLIVLYFELIKLF